MSREEDLDDVRDKIVEAATELGFSIATPDELQQFMDAGEADRDERNARALAEGRRFLDEENDGDVIKFWYDHAAKIDNLDALRAFILDLTHNYRHDYGTICHAISAAAIAGANTVERSDQGGITGFQAGFVMWGFVQHWMHNEGPMRLFEYANLLYPQYGDHYLELSKETWDWLKEQARDKLETEDRERVHPDVWSHWVSIAAGNVPFAFHLSTEGEAASDNDAAINALNGGEELPGLNGGAGYEETHESTVEDQFAAFGPDDGD